ncbi:MAG: glycosyltransferase family 4 protein [Solirubrobacterales bacterium]
MEIYARGLVPALRDAAPETRFTVFLNRQAERAMVGEPWLAGTEIVEVRAPPNRVGWVVADQGLVPRAAARLGVDVLHSIASTGPGFAPMARVVTVHDLIFLHHPEAHSRLMRIGMRMLVPSAARRADRVIAISKATKNDLTANGVNPERVDVVHNGGGHLAPAAPPSGDSVRARYDLGTNPVIFSPSAKRPHKNLARLLRAFAQLKTTTNPMLVVPGYPTPHEHVLKALAAELGIGDRVRFPGWIDDDSIEALYATARCVVFPSLYEGFGLPVVEALARGVPVACSDTSSLPEVGGEAAAYFDPRDVTAIASTVDRLLDDDVEAQRLAAAGPAQAAHFSWDRCAEGTLASYARALGDKH